MSATVRLTMPAKAEYLILARLALAGIARQVPIGETTLADLKLAVTEACGNAVRHAYGGAPGVVRVVFSVASEQIEVTVEDDGPGMAGVEIPDDVRLDGEPMEAGMGLAIIRAVVDELSVDARDGAQGTVVRIVKRLGDHSG